ncbi:filament-like plant protein 4 [Nymphaea colorata]|nr:filament-like plant protein 4 [Nymphaea colorata]
MDRRSWPWRKKSSEKAAAAMDSNISSFANSGSRHEDQEASKKANFVQVSLETYAKLAESEEQVNILNQKLSSAFLDMATKDNLVKQQAKVAEEAVSGWEKAEAEALGLKQQLEALTLQKLAADDRSSHLDGALKECMRQIRHIKEESEQKMQELVMNKNEQWEKIKHAFEAKISTLEQELLRASAENDALARSLEERGNLIVKMKEEKSHADAEIEILKGNIQSCEREISSMRYELHVLSKELEIRNEEKNMSVKTAEAANKQHLESVKRITKLEAECQRLRGLVRKKLPGPAALAQMKLEVENLGRDHGEYRLRRSPIRNSVPYPPPVAELPFDVSQQDHKEAEFLKARLAAMEEETEMLKEALAKCNNELHSARNMHSRTASKLHAIEAQRQSLSHRKTLQKPNTEIPVEGSLDHNSGTPPSLTSVSEDGIDDEASCAESWATALISELSQFKKETASDEGSKLNNSTNLDLMDDFLEMEKLAYMSTESNGITYMPNDLGVQRTDESSPTSFASAPKDEASMGSEIPSSAEDSSTLECASNAGKATVSQLQKRLSFILSSEVRDTDLERILDDIRCVLQEMRNSLPRPSVSSSGEQLSETASGGESAPQTADRATNGGDCSVPCLGGMEIDLTDAVSKIHDFVLRLAKEAKGIWKEHNSVNNYSVNINKFSGSVNKLLEGKIVMPEFILDLSHTLAEASELYFVVPSTYASQEESSKAGNSSNPQSKVLENSSGKNTASNEATCGSHSSSDECMEEKSSSVGPDVKDSSSKLLEEVSQLKIEKDSLQADLARCKESLEQTKSTLTDTESQLSELKIVFASSQKSNSLAETQLKCMTESYKLLELRFTETEGEVSQLKAKMEKLAAELQVEKHGHQEAVAKCNDLEEKLQRNGGCTLCSSTHGADVELKTKQEREIAAAAEKLAECQETIFLLGKHLKELQSPPVNVGNPIIGRRADNGAFVEDEIDVLELHGMHDSPECEPAETGLAASIMPKTGRKSDMDAYHVPLISSDTEASPITRSPLSSKRPKHRPSKSSSSPSSFLTPEKPARGIGRFFSRGKISL